MAQIQLDEASTELEDPADIGRARLVQERGARLGIEVERIAPFTLAIEQLKGDKRIGEVWDRTSIQTERLGDLRTRHRFASQPGEELELDSRQERLRAPEPHTDPQDVAANPETWTGSFDLVDNVAEINSYKSIPGVVGGLNRRAKRYGANKSPVEWRKRQGLWQQRMPAAVADVIRRAAAE